MVAVAKTGQPWSEVMAMSPVLRRCYLYTHAIQEGYEVNWRTGEVTKPKTERGPR
jgi:hypothetical protein